MKKILFLLLMSVSIYGQTYQNPTFGTVTTKTSPTVTNDPYLTTTGTTGVQGKIAPVNVLIPYTPINYTISGQTIGQQIAAIDAKFGTMGNTSAGITQRVDFTADNITVNSIVYFASSLSGKGSTASGSPPALVLADNTKAFFTKDVISIAQPAPTIGYAGVYSGNLTVSASPTPVATKQRFTVEIYRTDNLGNPIASGVSGAPVGDLGVTVLAILDSGELNLTAGSITNIPVTGRLTQNVTINTGERLRYHVSAAKIGTGGGNVTFGVYYGTSYNSYYDVPVAITTDAVLNKSAVTGAITDTDALNILNTKADNAGKYDWFTINATKREDFMLQREYNTNRTYTALTEREVSLAQPGDHFGHGAILNIHQASTKLYVVSIANQVDEVDNALSTNCFVRLQILQGNTSGTINLPILNTTTIAKVGDIVGGKTIVSGAGIPNAYMVGDILHITWTAQGNDGIWYLMHNTVNCLTDTIGTPEICTMDGGLMTSLKIATHLGRTDNEMISMNGTITSFGGYYYAGVACYDLWKNGAILRTTDFVDWEFAKEPIFTGIKPHVNWEISLGTLGSFMYMAMRQIDLDPLSDLNPILLSKLDSSLNVVDWAEVPSITSRPDFFSKSPTELYLVVPNNTRKNSNLLLIDPVLRDSRPLQDTPYWGNYVSVAQLGGGSTVQFAVRTLDASGIKLSSMNVNTITNFNAMTVSDYASTLTSNAQTQLNSKLSGTGVSGRLAFWTGTNTQSSDSFLFWDNTNKRLGIHTSTPGAFDLDVNGTARIMNSLDIYGGAGFLLNGSDLGTFNTRTNGTAKTGRLATPHYTNSEEPVANIQATSNSTTTDLNIGGGSGLLNTVTSVNFYSASNNTTLTGTLQGKLYSTGNWTFQTGGAFIDNGVDKLQITGTASGTVDATLSNQFVRKGQVDALVSSGSYTPTLTATANCSALTLTSAFYQKVGNIVSVSVLARGTTTSVNAITSFTATLPINKATITAIQNGSFNLGFSANSDMAMGYCSVGQTTVSCTSSTLNSSGSNAYFIINFSYDVTQ